MSAEFQCDRDPSLDRLPSQASRHAATLRLTRSHWACYSGFMDKEAQQIPPSSSNEPAPPSFQELAIQQGVVPVEEFELLLGRPEPEDESGEEFAVRLREWRREGTNDVSQQ